MKKIIMMVSCISLLWSCNMGQNKTTGTTSLQDIMGNYWEEHLQLFPLEATSCGDYRYNDKMTITIAESFRDSLKRFYMKYQQALNKVDTTKLNNDDQTNYRLLKYEMDMGIEGLAYPTHYMPINQFWALTIDLPQLGSGQGNQPFKTVKEYDDFLKRLSVLPSWTDTAISNMRKGINTGWILPKALVVKILPQINAMLVKDAKESIFYGAVKCMPDSFSINDKQRITNAYLKAIDSIIIPSYCKLYAFFDKEYMPKARESSGISALPNGKNYYDYCIHNWTTTTLSADSIYSLGLQEVARIEGEMNKVREQLNYKGDMKSFFEYINTDKKFFPFANEKHVLDSFWAIKKQEDPQLQKLFNHTPKSPFTIRQTEAFRAASASAEYNQASEDGTRPGIFYVPILNATKFNAVGMVTLFLHEAIPGHHYQISTQQENKNLPKFRRFLWYGAYGEGWALYSETLGKEMDMYDNLYQYFGHLTDAMHRAIRLVVDVGIHVKGVSREDAIQYMVFHEGITTEAATAEIERYMAIPGQALSYKIGQLTISAERKKYELQLGSKFHIASFHDEVLKHGCVPLQILQEKLAIWSKEQK